MQDNRLQLAWAVPPAGHGGHGRGGERICRPFSGNSWSRSG